MLQLISRYNEELICIGIVNHTIKPKITYNTTLLLIVHTHYSELFFFGKSSNRHWILTTYGIDLLFPFMIIAAPMVWLFLLISHYEEVHLKHLSVRRETGDLGTNYLLLRQLRLMVVESLEAAGMWPGIDSKSGYHCATGLLGLSSISSQWSLPIPIKLEPIAVQPISSLEPILKGIKKLRARFLK